MSGGYRVSLKYFIYKYMNIFRYIIIINNNDRARAESAYTCGAASMRATDRTANKIGKDKRSGKKTEIRKSPAQRLVNGGRWARKYKNAFRQRPHFVYV